MSCETRPFEPPYENGRIASPPHRSRIVVVSRTIVPMASSQLTRAKLAWPFGPVRIAGCCTRVGPYTRSAKRRTLAQMYPPVTGWRSEPSRLTTRPPLTFTARLHESGQSSGQAVSTVISCAWPATLSPKS